VLGVNPWAKQAEILAALAEHPRVTVRSCNGAGKTLCAAWSALWFLCTRPGSIVITTAPTGRQVKDLLWRRLRGAFHGAKQPLPGACQTLQLDCGVEWYALGMATDEEVKFQGPHSSAGVMFVGDEASGLAEWVFAAMEGSMTQAGAKMLLIGNPNIARGTFYESHRAWPREQKFHVSAFDTPEWLIDRSWIEEKRCDWGEESPQYQVRILGEFPTEGDDVLIPLSWCLKAQERDTGTLSEFSSSSSSSLAKTTNPVTEAVEIGVDISRYGSDESVAYARRGERVFAAAYWRGQDTMTSAARIAALAHEHGAQQIKVDDIGVGGGVVDRLQQLQRAGEVKAVVSGVNVSEAPRDKETFADRRTELYWGLRERFRGGTVAIPRDDTLLVDQLSQLRYGYSASGKLKLESKDDMRKRRGTAGRWSSPDRAEACMLCFAMGGNRWQPVSLVGSRPEEVNDETGRPAALAALSRQA